MIMLFCLTIFDENDSALHSPFLNKKKRQGILAATIETAINEKINGNVRRGNDNQVIS